MPPNEDLAKKIAMSVTAGMDGIACSRKRVEEAREGLEAMLPEVVNRPTMPRPMPLASSSPGAPPRRARRTGAVPGGSS